MEKTYTFEQIVFALRKEYLEVQKQLNELKKFIDTARTQDASFCLFTDMIILYLKKRKTLLDKIKELFGIAPLDGVWYDVTTDLESIYYFINRDVCSIYNPDELRKQINAILGSDFFKNIAIPDDVLAFSAENKNAFLLLKPGNLELNICGVNQNGEKEISYFWYSPESDTFLLSDKIKNSTDDEIYQLFSLGFSHNYFNDYHHRFLTGYDGKEIEIEGISDSLEIIEEPKKIVLRPMKVK